MATIALGALLRDDLQDFSPYVGQAGKSKPYKVQVLDAESDAAIGYIGEEGTGETLGAEAIVNGNMEVNANWIAAGSPVSQWQSNAHKHGGSFSWYLKTSAVAWGGIRNSSTTLITVNAGELFKFVFWVYPTTIDWIYVDLRNADNTGYILTGYKVTGLTQYAWNEVVIYCTAQTTGTATWPRFRTDAGDLAAGEWYFDDISYKELTETDPDIGIKIYSTKHGSTQSWESVAGTFSAGQFPHNLTYHVWEATSTTSSSTSSSSTSSSSTCSTQSTTSSSSSTCSTLSTTSTSTTSSTCSTQSTTTTCTTTTVTPYV